MFNEITLIGTLGKDAETKTTKSGQQYFALSVATNEKFKNSNGETQKLTTWHNVTLWGNYANFIQYLSKGKLVLIKGVQKHDQFEKDGQKKTYSYVKATEIKLMPTGEKQPQPQPQPQPQNQHSSAETDNFNDDLPF